MKALGNVSARTALALAAACCLAAAVQPAAAESDGLPAPDFVLKSLGGQNLRLSEYRGRVVAIGFWASWCGGCRAHMQGLAEFRAQQADGELELLTVNLDGDRRRAAESAGSLYPVLLDADGEVAELYGVESLPHVVLVDRDGVVRENFVDLEQSSRPYLDGLAELLTEW